MADDEYDLLPHKEIMDIKKELESLKGSGKLKSGGSGLDESIGKLAGSIDSLMDLFKTASEDMKYERHDEKLLLEKIEPLLDKLDAIIEQNEKIAKGIVAVADMIKSEISHEKIEEKPKLMEPDIPELRPEPMYPPPRMSPPSRMQPGASPSRMMPGPARMPPGPPRNFPYPSPPPMGQPYSSPMRPQGQPNMDMGFEDNQDGLDMPPPPPPPSFNDSFPSPDEPAKKGLFSRFRK